MKNQRIEKFLSKNKIKISPLDQHKNKEEAYTKRKFSSPIYSFHDTQGIQHYILQNKDYRRKTLHVRLAQETGNNLPSIRRISNLKNIIREYTHKNRIITETTTNNDKIYEIKYEILFTSNNTIKSYQYWIDELAYNINYNSSILLEELSLTITTNPVYKKIIPKIKTNQFINKNIIALNNNLEKLNNFEQAIISKKYQKEDVLPPYELAVELEFEAEFFKKHNEYYKNERSYYAHNYLNNIMHAQILAEEEDKSNIRWPHK